ncbi:hypothetical protein CRG98_027467 [Punica granatum]|uniref:Uncharacterized protein n=1 Tax=Punica granatum TaxID=22663 RepID=A0A2I0J731_PUNGR|nr:hypothetical protein CRG98_027467 [Punica granatum]
MKKKKKKKKKWGLGEGKGLGGVCGGRSDSGGSGAGHHHLDEAAFGGVGSLWWRREKGGFGRWWLGCGPPQPRRGRRWPLMALSGPFEVVVANVELIWFIYRFRLGDCDRSTL